MVNAEPQTMQLPAELLEYAECHNDMDTLKSRLAALDARVKELDPIVLDWFQRSGIQSVSAAGRNVHIRRELWAGKADPDLSAHEIREAFERADMEQFCEPRINTQSLSAWVREEFNKVKDLARLARSNSLEIDPNSVLPAALRGVVKVTEQFKLGVRKSTKR